MEYMKNLKRELGALVALRPHQYLVNFLGVCMKGDQMNLVSEYCPGGTLFDLLHKKKVKLDNQTKLNFCLDICKGLMYLHSLKPAILHRDLKSLNLLLDREYNENGVVKIADFGLAKPLTDESLNNSGV